MLKVFDVVQLKTGDKATILKCNSDSYKVEIVDNTGKRKGFSQISNKDIDKIILKSKNI